MSSSRTLSRKFRTFFTCIKPHFDPSIILLYIAASVEQYCDITQVNALPENEGILERVNHEVLLRATFFGWSAGLFFARGWVMNGVPLAGGHRDIEGQGHDEDQAVEAVSVAELGVLD